MHFRSNVTIVAHCAQLGNSFFSVIHFLICTNFDRTFSSALIVMCSVLYTFTVCWGL